MTEGQLSLVLNIVVKKKNAITQYTITDDTIDRQEHIILKI